jgi:hypothetical protein
MYNLISDLLGEEPLRFDFICDAKELAERIAYDSLVWEEKDKELVGKDSRGELFRIVRT